MITLLEELVERADGSYANKEDLRALEHVMASWSERKDAYTAVQEKEEAIVDRTIAMMQASPIYADKAMNNFGIDRCRRDIALSIRSYALGMLLQDEEMLKDRVLYWQKNIVQAMGLDKYQGYQFLLDAIYVELSPRQADLLKPYFKVAVDMITASNN